MLIHRLEVKSKVDTKEEEDSFTPPIDSHPEMPLFDFFQVFSSGSTSEPPKHHRSSSVASASSVPNLQVAGGSQKNDIAVLGGGSTTSTSPTSTSSPSIQNHQRSKSLNVIAPSSAPAHGYGHKRSLTETISAGSLLLETKEEPGLHRRNSTNMLSPCTENRPKLEKWEIESLFY